MMEKFNEFMRDDESIEDLQRDGMYILKKKNGFSYGHDAVLLSDFVRAKAGERIADVGTGTGILAFLVYAKTHAHMSAIDIQFDMCDMARRSVEMNGLCENIDVIEADIREKSPIFMSGYFDAAVMNPPYYEGGTQSASEQKCASVHEEMCSLEDAAQFLKRTVKNGGRLFITYPAKYVEKLLCVLNRNGFSAKRLCFVRSKREKEPYLLLCEAKHGANIGVRFDSDIILEDCE